MKIEFFLFVFSCRNLKSTPCHLTEISKLCREPWKQWKTWRRWLTNAKGKLRVLTRSPSGKVLLRGGRWVSISAKGRGVTGVNAGTWRWSVRVCGIMSHFEKDQLVSFTDDCWWQSTTGPSHNDNFRDRGTEVVILERMRPPPHAAAKRPIIVKPLSLMIVL